MIEVFGGVLQRKDPQIPHLHLTHLVRWSPRYSASTRESSTEPTLYLEECPRCRLCGYSVRRDLREYPLPWFLDRLPVPFSLSLAERDVLRTLCGSRSWKNWVQRSSQVFTASVIRLRLHKGYLQSLEWYYTRKLLICQAFLTGNSLNSLILKRKYICTSF